jgi:putative hydrolase of the HAD superfamily
MSHTIWIVPKEDQVRSSLHDTVHHLAQTYQGVEFEVHTTVLGDLQFPVDTITSALDTIASVTKPFQVETGTIEYSTTYYQCLFVRLKPNPELMTLYDESKKALGMTNPSVFMPHMSLFYGNIPYAARHQMMHAISIVPQTFTIDSLILTPGGEHPPSEWEHVYTAKLSA